MAFKTILVHVDDAKNRAHRLDAAAKLAGEHGARLVGVYLVPGIEMTPSLAAVLPQERVDRHLRDTGRAQHDAEDQFRQSAAAAGLADVEWRAPAGSSIKAAVAHGRCADLFVTGQSDGSEAKFAAELVTTVMLSSGHPTLIVPRAGPRATLGASILVAWNGGREATRAIADALPLLERAREVNIVAISHDENARLDDSPAQGRLLSWLEPHGIRARIHAYEAGEGDVTERLLSRVVDLGSDLVVMGGYGHTRMRELVLGGVTRDMLERMTVPVLMSH
jgi:nucleotide-binding universal stress UspA family protein